MKPDLPALLSAAAFALVVNPAGAVDVLFVDNETPHASWQALIESGGHTYTLFDTGTYDLRLGNQASKDYVNGFDVVVMSGSNTLENDAYDPGIGTAEEILQAERGARPDILTASNWWNWGLKSTPYLDIAVKELNHNPPEPSIS